MVNKNLLLIIVYSCSLCSDVAFAQSSIPSISHKPAFEVLKPGDTFLCIGRSAAGFDWIDGKWQPATFKPVKWLIRKEKSGTASCDLKNEKDTQYSSKDFDVWNLKRCYSYKLFGSSSEFGSYLNTGVCYESYSSRRSNGPMVQCTEFIEHKLAFVPNGEYLIQPSSANIPLESDAKNISSKFFETGSCSSM